MIKQRTDTDDLKITPDEEELVIDPVCDLELLPYETEYKSYYKGKVYYFCSEECLRRFNDCPERYTE